MAATDLLSKILEGPMSKFVYYIFINKCAKFGTFRQKLTTGLICLIKLLRIELISVHYDTSFVHNVLIQHTH